MSDSPIPNLRYVKEPWPHQRRSVEEAIRIYEETLALPDARFRKAGYAFLYEPRCGKSGAAINVIRYLNNRTRRRLRTLVFCPPRVVPVWRTEFGIHSKFPEESISLLQGSGERRCKLFRDAGEGKAHIFVTNYESLLMDNLFELFCAWKPEILVFDEAHRLKDTRAKRSKRAEILANPRTVIGGEKRVVDAPYTMVLTGSLILNTPMDAFMPFKIMDNGETFGYWDRGRNRQEPLTYRDFMLTYFTDRNAKMPKQKYFPKWEAKTTEKDGYDGKGEISKKISAKATLVKRVDVLELPPCEEVRIPVPLSAEQRRLYQEMKRDFVTEYKSNPVVARMALTKTIRLLQICSGFVKTDEGQEMYLPDIPKQDALKELLEKLVPVGKCLVWSVFKENYRQIREVCDALKIRYVEVHGEISSAQQDRNVKLFQTDEDVRVFIGHPESGGEGLNLVQATYNIFYSRGHSLKHSLQAGARNQSQDSVHEKTVRYDIVAEKTLDETVVEIVLAKEEMTKELYADLILKNLLQDAG